MRNTIASKKVTVFTGSFAVGGNGAAANDFSITETLAKYPWVGDVVLQWVVARTAGSSTTDLSILASLDGGTTYSSLVAFTQITGASGDEIKTVKVPKGALLKTDINLGAATTSTISLYAAGSILGG
jgi:hypothetical protein